MTDFASESAQHAWKQAALRELWRLIAERSAPNGTPIEAFGPYRECIEALRETYESTAETAALGQKLNDPRLIRDPADDVAAAWALWSSRPGYQELAVWLQQASAVREDNPTDLRWLDDQLALIPAGKDGVELRTLLQPALDKIISLDDDVVAVSALETLRKYFKWKADVFKAYRDLIVKGRQRKRREERPDDADAPAESDELGESVPPPIFLSPALAVHQGTVYVSQKMAFKMTSRKPRKPAVTTVVWKPVIIASDRRRIMPQRPPDGADPDSVWWLDERQHLALTGGLQDAPDRRWSYDSMVLFLNGGEEKPKAHEVFDALMASLKRYIHHADEYSYVVDVLWTMGTYFYRLWSAYPYLALHGEKGAGKTTLLTWLHATCFNAEFVVNTSEASLYRSIQAKAPTLLIDEQEGLNSSKAAKETKADLMGILKSGYKTGAKVARQRMDRPELTEYFDVYSPKALAAIELFEDVLENRAILTFMTMKPRDVETDDDGAIIRRDYEEFRPLRDSLYLLLMHEATTVQRISERVKFEAHNRFRELFHPLYAMAALVDSSRGEGRCTLDTLDSAAEAKARVRLERDTLTPEATLRESLRLLCEFANDDPTDYERGTLRDGGMVLVDTVQIKQAFEGLFSSRDQSFFNDTWLGKQVMKIDGITPATPRRRHRKFKERDVDTFEEKVIEKFVTCYVLDPAILTE